MSEILRLEDIWKSFGTPSGSSVDILKDADLSVSEGEVVSIMGKSGSGKSTLLSIAALLLSPDKGRIIYSGKDVSKLSEREVQSLRSRAMGFVFQSSLLLEDFSALENVAMPLLVQGMKQRNAYAEASRLLTEVGLADRADYRPGFLSGGERQRVAIARSLVSSPLVVFADEPTGSLDEQSASEIAELMFSTVRKEKRCLVMVTHDMDLAMRADRMLILTEGRLADGSI